MRSLVNSINKHFNSWMAYRGMTPEERYLSKSTDIVDLENRQKELMYGRRARSTTFFAGH